MIRYLLSAASLVAILIATAAPTEVNAMSENWKYLQEAQAYAREFENQKTPELLKQACLALEEVLLLEEDNADIRGQLRRDSLYLGLQLMDLTDRFLDPEFDPDDVPDRAVQPPPTSDGVLYPPGTDPAKIDDSMARAQYEQAITTNNAKIIHYAFQTKLRRLNERITPRAGEFIRNFYTPAGADQEELKDAIEETIHSARRKEALLKGSKTSQD
jgi:hypothetical protein